MATKSDISGQWLTPDDPHGARSRSGEEALMVRPSVRCRQPARRSGHSPVAELVWHTARRCYVRRVPFPPLRKRHSGAVSRAVDPEPFPERVSAFPSSGKGSGSTACDANARLPFQALGKATDWPPAASSVWPPLPSDRERCDEQSAQWWAPPVANCSSSVEPCIAVVEEWPSWITLVTSSK